MSLIYSTKRGDNARPLVIGLSRSDGSVVDLAGKVGRFFMRKTYSDVLVIDAPCVLDNDAKTATYQFSDAEAAVEAEYRAEIEIRNADGTSPETFPGPDELGNPQFIRVIFAPDLGDAL